MLFIFHFSGRLTLQVRDSNTPEPTARAPLKRRKSEVCAFSCLHLVYKYCLKFQSWKPSRGDLCTLSSVSAVLSSWGCLHESSSPVYFDLSSPALQEKTATCRQETKLWNTGQCHTRSSEWLCVFLTDKGWAECYPFVSLPSMKTCPVL